MRQIPMPENCSFIGHSSPRLTRDSQSQRKNRAVLSSPPASPANHRLSASSFRVRPAPSRGKLKFSHCGKPTFCFFGILLPRARTCRDPLRRRRRSYETDERDWRPGYQKHIYAHFGSEVASVAAAYKLEFHTPPPCREARDILGQLQRMARVPLTKNHLGTNSIANKIPLKMALKIGPMPKPIVV